jgi:hypothetical protein
LVGTTSFLRLVRFPIFVYRKIFKTRRIYSEINKDKEFRCKTTNKCSRVLSALLYSSNYPDIFRQLTTIFRGLHFLVSYSTFTCASGGCGLRFACCGQPPWNVSDASHCGGHSKQIITHIHPRHK